MKQDWALYIVLFIMIVLFLDALFYALDNTAMLN
jgi:hypothetical protein